MPQPKPHRGPQIPKSLLNQIAGSTNHKQRRAQNPPRGRKQGGDVTKDKFKRPHLAGNRNVAESPASDQTDGSDEFEGFEDESGGRGDHENVHDARVKALPPRESAHNTNQTRSASSSNRRQTEEDYKIAELERKLGISGKKRKPGSFAEDGLDTLLEGLDDSDSDELGSSGTKRKRDEDEVWLESKRRRDLRPAQRTNPAEEKAEEVSFDEVADAGEREEISNNFRFSDDTTEESDAESVSNGMVADDTGKRASQPNSARENPYIAPGSENMKAGGKYIPPSLRDVVEGDQDMMRLLKRKAQGLINRLSESNLLSILGDLEQLYRSHPRQYVSSTLIGILLNMLGDRSILSDSFLTLHAGLIAALYRLIGADFGAQVVERVCLEFDEQYNKANSERGGKEIHNLMSLLAQFYVFQVINSTVVFDYVRAMLQDLSEINTELLLRIVRSCGHQLRQDDPSALKDIVVILQRTVADTGMANLSVRTKFMIETIHDLKNNRSKAGMSHSNGGSERITTMKKMLAQLNSRPSVVTTEPLAISLSDLRDVGKTGKWWLVGASWKGRDKLVENGQASQPAGISTNEQFPGSAPTGVDGELLELAKRHHMNTDIRRAIFVTVMSSSDYKHCHMRLLKLDLSRNQEREIPRVLLHCATAEGEYNPYYTLIISRLCSERKMNLNFERTLQQHLMRIENADDEESHGDNEDNVTRLNLSALVNIGKLFGELIFREQFHLSVLKNTDLLDSGRKTKTFIEVVLMTIMQKMAKSKTNKVRPIFDSVRGLPDFAQALQLFLTTRILKSDLVGDDKTLKKVCKEVIARLKEVRAEEPTT